MATMEGGDVFANGKAEITISGASMQGAAAAADGGSIAISGNSTLVLTATTVSKASAINRRGCIGVTENATLIMVRSAASGCSTSNGVAGGIGVQDTATVILDNSNVTNNIAGTDAPQPAAAGGIAADRRSKVMLIDARVSGNKAGFGGGLFLMGEASLVTEGSNRITGNTAGTCRVYGFWGCMHGWGSGVSDRT